MSVHGQPRGPHLSPLEGRNETAQVSLCVQLGVQTGSQPDRVRIQHVQEQFSRSKSSETDGIDASEPRGASEIILD